MIWYTVFFFLSKIPIMIYVKKKKAHWNQIWLIRITTDLGSSKKYFSCMAYFDQISSYKSPQNIQLFSFSYS